MKPRIRFHGLLIFISVVLVVLNFRRLLPGVTATPLDDAVDAAALFLIVWGFAIRAAARRHKSRFSEGGLRLVTTGPYSAVRHPMYLGVLMIGTGVCLMILPVGGLLVFYAFMGLVYAREAVKEEDRLQQAFGMEYFVYRESVPALFPADAKAFMRLFIGLNRKALLKEWPGCFGVIVFVIATESVQHNLLRTGHDWPWEMLINGCMVVAAGVTVYVFRRLALAQRPAG